MAISSVFGFDQDWSHQEEAYKALPQTVREQIEQIFQNSEAYTPEAVLEAIRNRAGLQERCPDGQVYFTMPEGPGFAYSSFQTRLWIRCMPVLLFAIYMGEHKLAARLFESEEYGAPERMKPVADYKVTCGLISDLPFSAPKQEDKMYLLSEDTEKDHYYYILADQCREQKHFSRAFACRFLKKYYADTEAGWFQFRTKRIQLYVLQKEQDFMTIEETRNPVADFLDATIQLLDHIRQKDKDFYQKVISVRLFAALFANCCSVSHPPKRKENLRVLRKLYTPKPEDENVVWEEVAAEWLDKNILLSHNGYPDYSRCWEAITGRKLALHIGQVDLKALRDNDNNPPFGAKCLTEEDRVTGVFLQLLIRGADCVVYDDRRFPWEFDREYILKNCGEELALMAIRKNFIRKSDVRELLEQLEQEKKTYLIPALLLKAHGEWSEEE